ncbi:hypothetical protein MWU54_02100 [Marivita sp. S6314]|uniref:hypothetical protein n=1 Tax=Marivita sp. S6314 TaxID=2926406 RepID=UPI001FF25BE9|nr:hypothetical protein [Marivita sp. S6314]MCK0148801.1 hypothetical protein [Marivita sp. S6314]
MTEKLIVKSRNVALEAYRVESAKGAAYVPECLMDRLRTEARPSHQSAYEWIGAHQRDISRAIAALADGRTPRAPYDLVTLIEEAT